MQQKSKIALLAVFANICALSAQNDTISLGEVTVIGNKEKFQIGSKVEKIDSAKLEKNSGCSLAEALTKYVPIYVKQDADGLSSIRFRGTSANHTAVLYDGINLNSLTLGQTNLSHVPMFLFDNVAVQYGGASSFYGTDAIGGSISVGNDIAWNKGLHAKVQQDFGSFGHCFTGLKFNFSNKIIDYKLATYHSHTKNNFPFYNDISAIRDTTKNARNEKFGILQEANFNLKSVVLFAKIWYEHDARETQPDMYTNYYGDCRDYISDKYLRTVIGAKFYRVQHKLSANVGYVKNYELYNHNHDEKIETNTILANFEYQNNRLLKGELLANVNFLHIVPNMYAYDENLKENRCEISVAYKNDIFRWLDVSACLHESFVSHYKSQFSPSIGTLFRVVSREKIDWNITANVSRNYKIPTFNDRFWQPGGNPNLKNETSMNYEVGSKISYKSKIYTFQLNMNVYLLKMNNLIQWAPTDYDAYFWTPQNVESAKNKGLEFGLLNCWKWRDFSVELTANYAYCNAQNKNTNCQLIYTPKHLANALFAFNYKLWRADICATYTGERISETNKILDDYFLTDITIGRKIRFGRNAIDLSASVNNVFGVSYQNQENYAMPERNFRIGAKWKF